MAPYCPGAIGPVTCCGLNMLTSLVIDRRKFATLSVSLMSFPGRGSIYRRRDGDKSIKGGTLKMTSGSEDAIQT